MKNLADKGVTVAFTETKLPEELIRKAACKAIELYEE